MMQKMYKCCFPRFCWQVSFKQIELELGQHRTQAKNSCSVVQYLKTGHQHWAALSIKMIKVHFIWTLFTNTELLLIIFSINLLFYLWLCCIWRLYFLCSLKISSDNIWSRRHSQESFCTEVFLWRVKYPLCTWVHTQSEAQLNREIC